MFCRWRRKQKRAVISLDCIKEKISEIGDIDKVYLTGGEPLLHKNLKEIILFIKEYTNNIQIIFTFVRMDFYWMKIYVRFSDKIV